MRRFSKTGIIVSAVIGVLVFFGPFDSDRAFGQPPPPGAPVKVLNTPLPVTDAALQEIIRAMTFPVADPKRDEFTVALTTNGTSAFAGANIVLQSEAIVETVAALCSTQILVDANGNEKGYLAIRTPMGPGPSQIAASTPTGISNTLTLSSGLLGYWSLSLFPTGATQLFMPPTAVGYPVGKNFRIDTWTSLGQGVTCSVSIVVRYIQ